MSNAFKNSKVGLWLRKEKSFVILIASILLIRGSVLNWYNVPSESMLPMLEIGDYIVVNRLAYGVHLPFSQTKIMKTGKIGRGDVVVFDWPPDESILYVKRVIGIPGDRIKINEGQVFVNGEQICIPSCENFTRAVHPGESPYHVIPDQETGFNVPEDSYFALGDNRENSSDGRFWGFVPAKNIRGNARYVSVSMITKFFIIPVKIKWSRFFNRLTSAKDYPQPPPPSGSL